MPYKVVTNTELVNMAIAPRRHTMFKALLITFSSPTNAWPCDSV